jgi:hypothetical protein
MQHRNTTKLEKQIRAWILFMMLAIILSGVTAFPVETELAWLQPYRQRMPAFVSDWLGQVYTGISETNARFPFLAYGYDWLAFAHIVIALAFIGPFLHPVRNIWIIDWSVMCCLLVFPLALIAGPVRQIPLFHQVVDCCFGLFGLIPLFIVRRKIKRLEAAERLDAVQA